MDEFTLIRRWFAELTPMGEAIALGAGDDCALLVPVAGEQLAVTTDTLISGRHFPVETAAADIGWKRSEEHTSELQSLMRISYAVFCLKKKNTYNDRIVSYRQDKKHKRKT